MFLFNQYQYAQQKEDFCACLENMHKKNGKLVHNLIMCTKCIVIVCIIKLNPFSFLWN